MRVIFEPRSSGFPVARNTGIGLGNFDGLHIGHASLIKKLVDECHSQNLTSVIYTFTKHPENILRKKLFTPQITTTKKKIELLDEFNVDYLYLAEFDEKFSRMQPEEFIKRILVDMFGIKLAVVGYDYRFGFEGSGDVALLEHYGEKYHFDVIVVPPVYLDSEVVSSTSIRKLLSYGYVDKVSKFLGRPYSIQGLVIKGRNVGTKIGFPTANLMPEKYLIIPRSGVYITQISINGKLYNSLTNIGKNPTFKLKRVSVETHILDLSQDIYNETVEVFFHKRIRGEKKFDSLIELTKQINQDILAARQFFITNDF